MNELVGFSDVDWECEVNGSGSITNHTFLLYGSVVNWCSKRKIPRIAKHERNIMASFVYASRKLNLFLLY
jgi:hypothetical protein